MSLQINTKVAVLKDGRTKTYQYVYVVYGKNSEEWYNCGRVENEESWEKALEKIKEILEREVYNRLNETKRKIRDYMKLYIE